MHAGLAVLFLWSAISIPAGAVSLNETAAEEEMLASMERDAAQAPAREQCYLYSQVVHEMVAYSAREYASGEVEKATGMLKHTQQLTNKIRQVLSANGKKLRNAQILLRRAAYRLTDLLHLSSYDDRPVVQETLAQVEQAQHETMMQVFKK